MTMPSEASPAPQKTARHTESPLRLMAQAIGGPSQALEKMGRTLRLLAGYVVPTELNARLQKLHELGILEEIPTKLQLLVGSRDMVKFWIVPAAEEYYAEQGISFTFHQVLRFLDDPAAVGDPVGFFSTKDAIIGHLMQVVHANPCYDLELLGMFDDGLSELQRQTEEMIAGTHPRASQISAVVEEPDYHSRLLEYTKRFRVDPTSPAPLRSNIKESQRFQKLEKTFGSLRTAMRYFCRLPSTPMGAAYHLLFVREVPEHLLEPI